MTDTTNDGTEDAVELIEEGDGRYLLRLFVSGMRPRSVQAIAAIKTICQERLDGRYKLEVIDVYQHPELAVQEQIVAMPTLVKQLPQPLRRMVGDLSDTEKVLRGLDLQLRE